MRDPKTTIDRRAALAGAGAAGALAAAVAVLPSMPSAPPTEAAGDKPAPDAASGYRLTEHIKRYYATARI
jgi:hypothetical protein